MPFDGILQLWEVIFLGILMLSSLSFGVFMCAVIVGARADERDEKNYQMMLRENQHENRW